jgi:TonB-linked SusC/RagA family outer membrane protein
MRQSSFVAALKDGAVELRSGCRRRSAPSHARSHCCRTVRQRSCRWQVVAAVVCFQILGPGAALGQEGVVGGTVVAEQSLTPIPDAQVTVEGTGLGTVTDASGQFRIAGVSGTNVSLAVRRIGYRNVTQPAQVGDTTIRVMLATRAVELDQVVVTGTPRATESRRIGNAVAQIDAAEVVETAPVGNVQELINARAPGVVVMPGTGAVGSGSKFRVRGISSLSLSNEPLIYVDGVRINSQQASGPANQAFGSSVISRSNDINPENIESIEIIKGPAAATLYGTEASNGVIQIITKKGVAGRPRWDLTVKQGANWVSDPEGRWPVNYQIVDTTTGEIGAIDIIDLEKSRGNDVFHTGHLQEYMLSLSGGSERVQYYLSGAHEREEGAEPSNDLKRSNARANVSLNVNDELNIGANLGYVTGTTDLSAEAGYGGRVWTTILADPRNISAENRGFYSGTPEGYDALYHFEQGLNRFTGGLTVNHQPATWFSQRLTFGFDQTREENVIFAPRIDSLQSLFGSDALGFKDVVERNATYNTLDYAGTATLGLSPSITSATSIGGQYYRTHVDSVETYGEIFPAPGLSSVEATTSGRFATQDQVENVTVGAFAQQQFGWKDRLFLTLGLRADDNSAFGEDFDLVYYPKVSLAWSVSEEPFWGLEFVDALKLRAAYGESGQQPRSFASLRTYLPVTGPFDGAAVSPFTIGNPDLGPERGKEIELGFDAGLFGDRLGLEFTYYHKRTVDQILEREVAPSVGFVGTAERPGVQFINAGEVRNSGVELLARARPVTNPTVDWDVTFSIATNSNEVVDLGLSGIDFVPAATFLEHHEGFPVSSWFEKKVVSARLENGTAVDVLCDDGSGGAIACDEAPRVFLGRTTPKVEGAFINTVTLFGRLRLSGLLDFKTGHRKLDGNERVRCALDLGGRCREAFFPQEYDPVRIAQVQAGGEFVGFLIKDASYLKLRELSASYELPTRWANLFRAQRARVTIAGRNLHTWTEYSGLEPEATFLGGSRGGGNSFWEQTTLPQLTQFVTTIDLTF